MNDYWSHNPNNITVNAVKIAKDDPTVICGQFDSGADATVTNLLPYLPNYQPYTCQFKCPVQLTGAVGSTNIYPLGKGFLHLPALTLSGYLGVCCFYSPDLTSTLVSPRDILKTSLNWKNGFSGQDMKTYFGPNGDPNFGRCTFTCHNNCHRSKNISTDGIVMSVNCYTYPLILPDVHIDSPLAISLNCMKHASIYDDAFIEKSDKETANAISQHKKAALQELDAELTLLHPPVVPNCKQLQISNHFDYLSCVPPVVDPLTTAIDATPFKDLLLKSIPVHKIHVETEHILWHQHLGHPCDEYLYSAHKFINGVPKN